MTDYGITLEAILSGKERVPPQGVRIDVTFVGRLAGRVRGIDYLRMRADGRIDLHILAVVETENGCRIALSADGVTMPRVAEPIADLLFNVSLTTAAESYAWVNTRQVGASWDREFRCWQDSGRRIHAVNFRPPF